MDAENDSIPYSIGVTPLVAEMPTTRREAIYHYASNATGVLSRHFTQHSPPQWNPTDQMPGVSSHYASSVQLTNWRQTSSPMSALPSYEQAQHRALAMTSQSACLSSSVHNLVAAHLYRQAQADDTKSCCRRIDPITLIRMFIVGISLIGLSCVVAGIILGSLTVSGSMRLTLCLLMTGVGSILVTVSVVAWRLTAPSSTDRVTNLFARENRRSTLIEPRSTAIRDPHQEIFYRTPPPTYTESVQNRAVQEMTIAIPAVPISTLPSPSPSSHHHRIINSPPPVYRPFSRHLRRQQSTTSAQTLTRNPPRYEERAVDVEADGVLGIIPEAISIPRAQHHHANSVTVIDCSGECPSVHVKNAKKRSSSAPRRLRRL